MNPDSLITSIASAAKIIKDVSFNGEKEICHHNWIGIEINWVTLSLAKCILFFLLICFAAKFLWQIAQFFFNRCDKRKDKNEQDMVLKDRIKAQKNIDRSRRNHEINMKLIEKLSHTEFLKIKEFLELDDNKLNELENRIKILENKTPTE